MMTRPIVTFLLLLVLYLRVSNHYRVQRSVFEHTVDSCKRSDKFGGCFEAEWCEHEITG